MSSIGCEVSHNDYLGSLNVFASIELRYEKMLGNPRSSRIVIEVELEATDDRARDRESVCKRQDLQGGRAGTAFGIL